MDFKIGDLVRLKSGGPAMTVSGADHVGEGYTRDIYVIWFAGHELKELTVMAGALEPAKRRDPSDDNRWGEW